MSQSLSVTPPSRLRTWIHAARPPTLPAAVVPVLVGTAAGVVAAPFKPLPFLAALVASLLIQIGTNFANDLFDFHKGADTDARMGPVRVTQSGLISPEQVKRATYLTFGAATLVGLYLVFAGGWPILVIGLLSIIFGVAYTGGPWPLGYHGLGDVAVFIFFGVIAVTGSAYLQNGSFGGLALAASVPVGLLVTNILVINNLRDVPTDRVAGKRTLAVRIGEQATRWQYLLFTAGAYAVPLLLWFSDASSAWVLLSWLSLPLAIPLVRGVMGRLAGRALNPVLKRTGQLHLVFGLLFTIGLLL
ncbi:1,4-dihydroxy-2-naphthoate polyprenyltransferase [Nitrolancea hollandica]|uniref:1,4-dihydroxy-2-naphthoate octaprenyltransferase n=1 Tax=Nitrolancea hollandica Lb TaxID=1129897 RepID=I4EJK1_9BACT|nr:1,4-dihydroxy-2-naphthoate polyprenyltransferase [Nitrolancea hollandica]CCF84863.1 1, 4-dihydroxy-2-naphthoateoctaprenyltransferase [Nitrolancea hollandica Lb]